MAPLATCNLAEQIPVRFSLQLQLLSSISQNWLPADSKFTDPEHGHLYREREREIHYVHWASKAYEDESVFMSEADLGWQ